MSKYLIVNPGSASKKYAIYEDGKEIAFIHLETCLTGFCFTVRTENKKDTGDLSVKDFDKSLPYLFNVLKNKNIVNSPDEISGVGIRIVAPGLSFQKNSLVDKTYIKRLHEAKIKAPLHLDGAIEEIERLRKFFGKNVKLVGISDSAFHIDMPEKAKKYAIPLDLAKKYEIYRYGYHGISLRSIIKKIKSKETLPDKVIVCHIGGGVSITAIKSGVSIDTSMGFTPLEGMVMANRVGNIDSGAIIYMSEVLKMKGDKLRKYLNKECGLLGLSGGRSADIRDLLKFESEGDTDSKMALDIYTYKIQKQIGAFAVALGGIDKLVFSGTVGERSFIMRKRICDGLDFLGIKLDENINNATEGKDNVVSSLNSKVKV
jgi:acetate kinase